MPTGWACRRGLLGWFRAEALGLLRVTRKATPEEESACLESGGETHGFCHCAEQGPRILSKETEDWAPEVRLSLFRAK